MYVLAAALPMFVLTRLAKKVFFQLHSKYSWSFSPLILLVPVSVKQNTPILSTTYFASEPPLFPWLLCKRSSRVHFMSTFTPAETTKLSFNQARSVPRGSVYALSIMHQSITAAPSPSPPPGLTPGISIFFVLDGKFSGVGTLELSNPPMWGREKRANAPSPVSTATFFIDRTVEYCRFKHFNVRFFVSINVLLCNSARILIKTSCRDDMYQFIILVLM